MCAAEILNFVSANPDEALILRMNSPIIESMNPPDPDRPHGRRAADRGRPREFDVDHAIEAAGRVFWQHGYHATPVDVLCEATGVFRGSLYRTFGDKHGLLVAAFDRYAEGAIARLKEKLASDLPPREALREALLHYTRVSANLSERHGCFITNAIIELLPNDHALRPHIEATLQRIATQFSLAIARGQQAGQFDRQLDAEEVGRFLLCMVQGIRVLGKVDMNEVALTSIVDMALRALA
jgi:TetR/AcrR family transcriptional regulator, transcriptional repressor for nem operon